MLQVGHIVVTENHTVYTIILYLQNIQTVPYITVYYSGARRIYNSIEYCYYLAFKYHGFY